MVSERFVGVSTGELEGPFLAEIASEDIVILSIIVKK